MVKSESTDDPNFVSRPLAYLEKTVNVVYLSIQCNIALNSNHTLHYIIAFFGATYLYDENTLCIHKFKLFTYF